MRAPSRTGLIVGVHVATSMLALLCLVTFWLATVASELFWAPTVVVRVKAGILYGLVVLVPALMISGLSGRTLSKRRSGLGLKTVRLRWAALTGITVLVPCAVVLWRWARDGEFGPAFVALRGLELLAGASNIRLSALNASLGFFILRKSHGNARLTANL